MKKIISFALALALALCLCGCESSSTQDDNSPKESDINQIGKTTTKTMLRMNFQNTITIC